MTDANTPDCDFAQQLVAHNDQEIAKFGQQFSRLLQRSYDDLCKNVPDCGEPLPALVSHVAYASAAGFLKGKARSKPFELYVQETVNVCDLLIASACLKKDAACWQHLIGLVETYVRPSLASWRRRLSPAQVDEVVDNLPAQCWSQPTKGAHADRLTISRYYGRSKLTTWLTAMAANALRDLARKPNEQSLTHEPGEAETPYRNTPGSAASPEETVSLLNLAEKYHDQFIRTLRETFEELTPRERHIAYLRFVERRPQKWIADQLGVSPAYISQVVVKVRKRFLDRADSLAEELAEDSGIDVATIRKCVGESLESLLSGPE